MKKKIIAALMAMTMSLSIVACTNVNVSVPATSESSVEGSVETTVESDAASSEDSLEEAANAASSDAAELEADLEENAIEALGKVDGDVYKNEYFGLQVALPAGFAFADDEMISTVYGYTTDILSETDNKAVAKQLESGAAQIVALGYDSTGLNTINITVQQNVLLANAIFDEKAVITMSLKTITDTLEAQGIQNITSEIVDMEIAGETHTVLKLTGEYQGMKYNGLMCNLQKGNYMLAMGATSFNGDQTEDMFSNITALQ